MKRLWQRIIVWYLRQCAGAFHSFPYGEQGRYVVLMNELQYHNHKEIANAPGYICNAEFVSESYVDPEGL